jgi:C4-dicarboxylate-specific signal transduction histidine kinase
MRRPGAKSRTVAMGMSLLLWLSLRTAGDRVEITVSDSGTGIPREVKEKMFNPFFTTKPAGEGHWPWPLNYA